MGFFLDEYEFPTLRGMVVIFGVLFCLVFACAWKLASCERDACEAKHCANGVRPSMTRFGCLCVESPR